jgi:hypothetical protein
MAKPFELLPQTMAALSKDVQRRATEIVRQVATGVGATLVDTTRVDTGAARSNWRASLNQPLDGTIPPYAPGNKLGASETGNSSLAKAQQKSTIDQFDAGRHKSIFITNNIPYIETLNNGRPSVAADNMVEQALLTGREILRSLRVLRK